MKTTLPVLVVSLLVLLSACAPKVNDPADVQAVKQTMEAYTEAILAKDAQASVAVMTDKTAYFEPHMPAQVQRHGAVWRVADAVQGADRRPDRHR
jgi:hypothetical protein